MSRVGFFCLLLTFCQGPQKKEHPSFTLLTIDELKDAKEHIRTIELTKKPKTETVELILESQPGTGYSWKEVENNSPLTLLQGGRLETKENIPGGVSNTLFTYQIGHSGEGEITFLYRQHWQKQDPHEKKLILKVKVR